MSTSKRLGYIDGLRAIAVLGVVGFHMQKYAPDMPSNVAERFFAGCHGVELFFIVSGFCLSYPLLSRCYNAGTCTLEIAQFYAKRIARIVPPYYVALALALLASTTPAWHTLSAAMPEANVVHTDNSIGTIAHELLFLDDTSFPHDGSWWTLAIEWSWYLSFPLLIGLWFLSQRAFYFALFFFVAVIPNTKMSTLYTQAIIDFMLGVVAANLSLQPQRWTRFSFPAFLCCISIGLAFAPGSSHLYSGSNTIWQFTCFLLVVSVGEHALLRRTFSFAPLAAIGTASYSIYLIHEPLLAYFEEFHIFTPYGAFLAACLAGGAFWFIVERSFATPSITKAMVVACSTSIERVLRYIEVPNTMTFVLRKTAEPDQQIQTTSCAP